MAEIQLICTLAFIQGGLHADVAILTQILQSAGHRVTFTRGQPVGPGFLEPPRCCPSGHRFDCNIFVEHCGPREFLEQYRSEARYNVFLPNAEYFSSEWIPCLELVDTVWAKTRDCETIFRRLVSDKVVFTSFTSWDQLRPIEPTNTLFHGPGYSPLKGTEAVLSLWEGMGAQLPPLHLFFSEMLVSAKVVDLFSMPNVLKNMGRWNREEYAAIQSQHRFHLCPSRYEGFGHYIHEAKSAGAIVLTVDAPPMNEFVRPSFGILVPSQLKTQRNLATCHEVSPEVLGYHIQQALLPLMKDSVRTTEMGAAARADFLRQDRQFRERLPEVMEQLLIS